MQRLAQELSRLRSGSRHRSLSLPQRHRLHVERLPRSLRPPGVAPGLDRGARGRYRRRRRRLPPAARPPARACRAGGVRRGLLRLRARRSTSRPAFSPTWRCSPPCRTGTTPSSTTSGSTPASRRACTPGMPGSIGCRTTMSTPSRTPSSGPGVPARATSGSPIESVYSMDGDIAPVAELHALARVDEAVLIVDEAHGTGIFGAIRPRLQRKARYDERLIVLHTCGKALGVAGGLVCGPSVAIDYLINAARPFIYSTAPPAYVAAAVRRALDADRRGALAAAAAAAAFCLRRSTAGRHGRDSAVAAAGTQIIPVILGDAAAGGRSGGGVAAPRLRRARHPPADGAGGHLAAAHLDRRRAQRGRDRGAGRRPRARCCRTLEEAQVPA